MSNNDIINQAKELRDNHRGAEFNPNYATINNIRKVAKNFINKKCINVESITSINKIIQYMISAKVVGDRYFYHKLCEYTNHILDSFCDNIEIEDNCYDGFDKAVERHLYRENSKIYDYLKSKHVRYLDGGLVKYKNSYDIFLPDYQAIVDVSTWKAEEEVKQLVENSKKETVNNLDTWELRNIRNFEYHDNKLRCTGEKGDPLDIDGSDIKEYIVDTTTEFKDIKESDFIIEGCGSGRGRVCTSRYISVDQLHEGDEVIVKNGLVYHNLSQHCYMIVGPYELIHLKTYDDYNNMSIVYAFNDKNKHLVDLIRLRNLSCDTITKDDWEEDHAINELKPGFVYLTIGRTIMTRMQIKGSNNNIQLDFNDVQELLNRI